MRWNAREKKIQPKIKEPSFKNPLFDKENPIIKVDNIEIFLYTALLFVIIVLYFIFYSPYFTIKEVEFKNLVNISPIQLTENYLKPQLNSFNYLFTKQNNIFSFSKTQLKDNISEEYSLESIIIDKKIPNKIIITINEKLPTLIYQSSGVNYFLDENGIITKALSDEEINNEEKLPTIVNLSSEKTTVGQELFSGTKLENIKLIINSTKDYSRINIVNYEVPVLLSTQFNIFTEEGYKIYFDTSKDPTEQFDRLKRVLEETDTANNPNEYIDLRIGERVYIK